MFRRKEIIASGSNYHIGSCSALKCACVSPNVPTNLTDIQLICMHLEYNDSNPWLFVLELLLTQADPYEGERIRRLTHEVPWTLVDNTG
jgi:hypothetical protein